MEYNYQQRELSVVSHLHHQPTVPSLFSCLLGLNGGHGGHHHTNRRHYDEERPNICRIIRRLFYFPVRLVRTSTDRICSAEASTYKLLTPNFVSQLSNLWDARQPLWVVFSLAQPLPNTIRHLVHGLWTAVRRFDRCYSEPKVLRTSTDGDRDATVWTTRSHIFWQVNFLHKYMSSRCWVL